MKIATFISTTITALLMSSTMICGFWIRENGITDASSFEFHIGCGIAGTVFSFTTLALVIIQFVRMKKGVESI